MNEKRALSKLQFIESGFETADYEFVDEPGIYTAAIDCKRWGKNKLITYFTFDDGRKVVAATWFGNNYLGLADLPVGSRVELDFQYSKSGKVNIKSATPIRAE